jgi:hypothetical protein
MGSGNDSVHHALRYVDVGAIAATTALLVGVVVIHRRRQALV